MDARPAYDSDPRLRSMEARVVRTGDESGRPFAVLNDTLFYPEGGGQPADRGSLAGLPVLDVQKREGEIRHYLATPAGLGPVLLELDWDRRFDHMQQHTGQHLLTAVAQEHFGWETTAFHLGEETCDIELAVQPLSSRQRSDLEAAVAAEIRAARPLQPRWVSPEEYVGLAVRSRGLPDGHSGPIRLVEIMGLDLNTCGGTHLASTGEIELLKLLGSEPIRGGCRLFFLAGGRARRRLEAHETRSASLRTLLGAPDEELVPALEAKLEQLRALDRRSRGLEEDLAAALAEGIANQAGSFVERHFEGRDAGFLQRCARQALALAPAKALFFTSTTGGQSFFLLAAGEGSTVDAAVLGREVAALLMARGGGSGRLFQGKAEGLAGRAAAVALIQIACGA
jgi:Ser-tRNA(Ala) deacylase AlaX